MFWCDFTLDLPKISAKEPFNPPLLPPPSHSAQPSPFHHRFDARGSRLGFELPPPLHLPPFLSPTSRPRSRPIPVRLRALAQCRLKRLHCLKEAERNRCVSIITLSIRIWRSCSKEAVDCRRNWNKNKNFPNLSILVLINWKLDWFHKNVIGNERRAKEI